MTNRMKIAVHGTQHRNIQVISQQLRQLNGGLILETVAGQLLLRFAIKDLERRTGSMQISRFLRWSVDRIALCQVILWQKHETLMNTWLQD